MAQEGRERVRAWPRERWTLAPCEPVSLHASCLSISGHVVIRDTCACCKIYSNDTIDSDGQKLRDVVYKYVKYARIILMNSEKLDIFTV